MAASNSKHPPGPVLNQRRTKIILNSRKEKGNFKTDSNPYINYHENDKRMNLLYSIVSSSMKSVEHEILRFRSTCYEVAKGKGNVVTLRLSLNCCIKIRKIFTASCQHMTHTKRHILNSPIRVSQVF